MKLFIQIRDGFPYEHPIMEDNFVAAFPWVDINNLPPEFAQFVRVEKPLVNEYEVYQGVTYEWVDGVVKDVHHVRPMTAEEKAAYDDQKAKELAALLAAIEAQSNMGVTRV